MKESQKPIAVKISHEQIAMHFVKSIRTYHAAFKFALPSFATDSKRAHEGHITKKRVNQSPPLFGKKGKHITNWNAITQIAPRNSLLQKVYSIFKKNLLLQECTFRIGMLFSCLWPQFPPSKVCKRTFQGAPEWHQASDGQAVVHQSRALPLPDSLSCHDSATGSPFLQLYYFEHRCWHF